MIELGIILVSAFLLLVFTFRKRRSPAKFRELPAYTRLSQVIGLSVEDGTRLHISLGRGDLLTLRGASGLAGLGFARIMSERTSVSDNPLVVTAGDPALALLTQDTLRAGFESAKVGDLFSPNCGRLAGMGPFGYAAGVMPIVGDENVSANVLIGNFGAEIGLLAESAERERALTVAASDDLTAQAVLYASAQEPLLGEETFAAGAYLGKDASHSASLTVQDILRWLAILALLAGAVLKALGGF
jgi:hypothetical protein